MSWSRPLRPLVLSSIMLGLGAALGACSFSPVYSGALASQPMLNLAFAKPTSRVEQVINQELALRFGASDAPDAALATVRATTAVSGGTLTTTANPAKDQEVTVTATLTISRRDGVAGESQVFTRAATAGYTRSGQVLADNAAAAEAADRAARSAAESLRLAVLAGLSR